MGEKFGITAPIRLLRGSVRFNTTTTQSWLENTLHALMEYLLKHICQLISLLCSSLWFLQTSQRIPDRFRQHTLFGTGKGVSEAWWRALGRELISEKYLMETSGYNKFSTLCKLTPKVLLPEAHSVVQVNTQHSMAALLSLSSRNKTSVWSDVRKSDLIYCRVVEIIKIVMIWYEIWYMIWYDMVTGQDMVKQSPGWKTQNPPSST